MCVTGLAVISQVKGRFDESIVQCEGRADQGYCGIDGRKTSQVVNARRPFELELQTLKRFTGSRLKQDVTKLAIVGKI